MNSHEEIIETFWRLFDEGNFDEAGSFMDTDVIVLWPNTREIFKGRDKFILVNKKYPGRWRIFPDKIFSKDNIVISVVKVEADDKTTSFYTISFFEFQNNLIHRITEYWGSNCEPPQWRQKEGLSERF
ncbi:MAG: hypothetical protein M1269_10915 [Chloroflexi bacterium]|nr:hypothetical protein [Chloroflexota bacterium]